MKPAECDSLPPLEDEIKCMRPPDLYEVVCQLSPTEMWYHLRFVPMQEAAAAQKRAAAEKLYVVHECTNQCAPSWVLQLLSNCFRRKFYKMHVLSQDKFTDLARARARAVPV